MDHAHWSLVTPCLSFFPSPLTLFFMLIPWGTEAFCIHFPAWASKIWVERRLSLHFFGRPGGCLLPSWTLSWGIIGFLCKPRNISLFPSSIFLSVTFFLYLSKSLQRRRLSWGYTWIPRSMSALERNPEVLASTPDWHRLERNPSQLTLILDFPEATRVGPWGTHRNSRGTPNFLPQLEKNHEIIPSTRDEAHFHCGMLREILPSLFSLEMVLDTLDATQEVPRHTCLH